MPDLACHESWVLAQVKPNGHHIAVRNLHRQDYKTFLPMHEETKRRGGRFVTTLRPLFGGYLFIAMNPMQQGWRVINNTHGITRLVCTADTPISVPADLISQLKLRCGENDKILPEHSLKAGDKVTLSTGPFANFVAKVEAVTTDQRVWILLDLMGRAARLQVPKNALQGFR
jgi:transcriptional antiterminator RfaH